MLEMVECLLGGNKRERVGVTTERRWKANCRMLENLIYKSNRVVPKSLAVLSLAVYVPASRSCASLLAQTRPGHHLPLHQPIFKYSRPLIPL